MATESRDVASFCALATEISNSFSSGLEAVKLLRQDQAALDTKDGISLLSLKHHLLLSYLNSSCLVTAHRIVGHSLSSRSRPMQTITALDREARGGEAGDLVDGMVEYRVTLEKMKALEARLHYQISKLARLAQEQVKSKDVVEDSLAFRPNPQNLITEQFDQDGSLDGNVQDANKNAQDKIYRPPRLARMPYVERTKSRPKSRVPIPSALAALPQDPTQPLAESTSGLGTIPSGASGRATYLKRLNEYEEETFSRLVMKKTDAKKRLRDEADLALGGELVTSGSRMRRQAGSLEDAFGDVLKSIERKRGRTEDGLIADGYEELRKKGRKHSALERSRRENVGGKRYVSPPERDNEGAKGRKRTRFELEAKLSRRKRAKYST